MKMKAFIWFFIFHLSCNFSFGQDDNPTLKNLKFKHFSLTEGLSQSSVLCLLQDKKGFLWFGTRDGLNKFDGYNFKTYRFSSQDSTSISHSFIKSLFEDTNGNIWVGTINGLNKYIAKNDTFKRYAKAKNSESIQNKEIWSIASADDEHLWLGTNFGLEKFNIKNEKTIHFKHQKNNDNSIRSNKIRTLTKTQNGDLWVCTTENIDVYRTKSNTFDHYGYPQYSSKGKNFYYAPVIYQDDGNTIWLGFKNGLSTFNEEQKNFEPFKLESSNSFASVTDEVRSIQQDYLGDLWVGTYKGLYIIKGDKSSISHIVHDENDPNSLSQNSIYKIFEDSKGDIWIGTYAGGINYYDRSFDLFKNFSSGTNNLKLNYKVVSSIIEDTEHNLWIGTEGGGVNFLDKTTGTFNYFTHNEKDPNSLSADNVKSMIRTQNGNFWIGTHDGGLNFLNTKRHPYIFKKYKNIPDDSTSLSNNRVISLFEDYEKNIWIGTSGGGINVFDNTTKTVIRISDSLQSIGNFIYTISKTSDKNTLLIGGGEGLAKINIQNHQIIPIKYKEDEDDLYNTSATLCVYEDHFQNLWISTEGDGLYYYNSNSNKSIKYGIPEGLPNEVIYGILPDDFNNIWLSTNHGLSRLNLVSRQFKNFDSSAGLIGNEFNYGSFLKLSNGDLMFGGVNGLNLFNPNEIIENAFIPPVLVTSILVNNKPFLNKSKLQNEIILRYDQNVFSFNFVALSYSQPNKNQYAYKLEGFDLDWNYIGNKKSATYTNLDSGEYLFKVKASNSDGLWNEKGKTVIVTILPAPWETGFAN